MRIASKGQVTIPAEIREQAGVLAHAEVESEYDGTVVRLVPARSGERDGRGARLVAHLPGARGRRDEHRLDDGVDPQRRLNEHRSG